MLIVNLYYRFIGGGSGLPVVM